jgi:hypothetical protein
MHKAPLLPELLLFTGLTVQMPAARVSLQPKIALDI